MLNTTDITKIPQHRERIYIVCVKDKEMLNNFTLYFKKIKKQSIRKMLVDDVDEKYYYNNKENNIHNMIIDAVIDKDSVYQFRRVNVKH